MELSGGDANGGTPSLAVGREAGMLLASGLALVLDIWETWKSAHAASARGSSRELAATWS